MIVSRLAQIVTVGYVGVAIWYLWWRTLNTVNTEALPIAIPFLIADYLGFFFFGLFAMTLWSKVRRTAPAPAKEQTVDVLIPTYNEDTEILRPTIAAVLAMDYPHETYVLDDGRRDEVRALCEQMGVRYLTREDNRGAKAGNINAALPQTSGDFIAIFDADHAPFRNFLTAMLGYFTDEKVGLVQAPQSYYNLDSFQHASSVRSRGESPWHEQSVFYDAIMPGKDRWNAAFWCGSGAIVRRAALEEVGGVDTRTVTEDMHTCMNIHAAGWTTLYHDDELAVGIAPDDANAFLKQRLRWAQGALQIFRYDNPLFRRGLNMRQRLSYFSSVAYVFEYMPKAVYLMTPVIALIVGALPMTNMGWNLVFRFLPYWVLGIVTSRLLTGGTNPHMESERFHLLKLWIALRATTAVLLPGRLSFEVTPKRGDGADHRLANLSLIKWQIAAGAANLAAVIWAVAWWRAGATWQLSGISLAITSAWALYNAGLVASLVRTILARHHRRHVYRFDVSLAGNMTHGKLSGSARITDLSSIGAGWQSAVEAAPGETVALRFHAATSTISAKVRVATARREGDVTQYGGEFVELGETARRSLVLYLYQQHAPSLFEPESAAAA